MMVSALATSAGVLVDALTGRPRLRAAGCEVIHLRLALPGGPMAFHLAAPERPVRLSELVPVCRYLSSQIMQSAVHDAGATGESVACRKFSTHAAAARALGLKTGFFVRPTEYGPGQTKDIKAESNWDIIAQDVEDLARQLGV